jgi:hypothetical protein
MRHYATKNNVLNKKMKNYENNSFKKGNNDMNYSTFSIGLCALLLTACVADIRAHGGGHGGGSYSGGGHYHGGGRDGRGWGYGGVAVGYDGPIYDEPYYESDIPLVEDEAAAVETGVITGEAGSVQSYGSNRAEHRRRERASSSKEYTSSRENRKSEKK